MTLCLAYAPTEPGRAALAHCAAEARRRGCPVVVVNAAREWDDTTPAALGDEDERTVSATLSDAGVDWRWYDGPHGLSGADEILTAAETEAASLIVIGVTDRSHVQKRIVSDTTKHVLLDAPCDVLAVRADHAAPVSGQPPRG